MSKEVKRLADDFKPSHYILQLEIDKANMVFSGTVIIAGHKLGKPAKRLVLHQSNLKITSATIIHHQPNQDVPIKVERFNRQQRFEELRLHTTASLGPGLYTITVEFKGQITDAMNGIYPCYFKYKNKDKKLIATQFESHHAREVFPCIDEPEAKATFDLTLTHPADETAISNTPIKKQDTIGKKQMATTFETTPKMSTYLLAFVIGELKFKETKTRSGVAVRAYATPSNVEFTDFALEFAVKCLEFYNDYFGIDYPLAKCDLIALPDFASGAMENWGCITFREQALLVDPVNSSLLNKQYVAMVVAHELAHQWFGNLVTMRWWTDLWLNEGFASWIEYLAVDYIYPEWQMWTQFVGEEQQQAMKLDALANTHPVEVAIYHPDEIRTIFDAISYSKGSSVLHMLSQYLDSDIFREGLSFYLSKHAYGNTDTVDLWVAFEEVSAKPVKKFMAKWTALTGFPLVHAVVDEQGVQLEQSRFFVNPKTRPTDHHLWPIPLLSGQPEQPEIQSTKTLNIPSKATSNLKFNRGQSGFYRVVYNATHLRHLGEQIRQGKLVPLDRLGLLSDHFEAAKAGYTDTAGVLQFLANFADESNSAVWDVIASLISSLRLIMDDEELREDLKPYIRRLTAKQLARLGWVAKKDESHFDRLLRPTILNMAALAEDPRVVKKALALFKNMQKPADIDSDLRSAALGVRRAIEIDPDLRGVVYGTAVRHGGQTEFNKLLAMHRATQLSEERSVIASALTGFKQPALIKQALGLITTEEVRKQDVAYWIVFSFMNRFARRATWHWLKQKWGWLEQNLGSDLAFYRMPIYAARSFSDPTFLDEFTAFFDSKKSPALERSIKQGQEIIEWQAAWRQRDLKLIKAFFKTRQQP